MKKPFFSIVIAVAPDRNAEVKETLAKLDYPKNKYEIIIERGFNPSENRNRGAKKSKGEIIAFIDDDALVNPDLLTKAEEFFKAHEEIAIVGGPQLTPLNEKGFAKISGYALSSFFGAWIVSNRYAGKDTILNAGETMLTSANLFCRKKVFGKIKFNPSLFPGEDPDFIARAKAKSIGIAYSPQIIVYHRRRSNLSSLAKQIFNYGKTRPKKETLSKTLKMPFFLVPSIFLIYLILLDILFAIGLMTKGLFPQSFLLAFSFPLILYVFLNLLFSLANALTNKDILSFFVLPIIFINIHISYGLGFLISTFRNIFKAK